MTYLYFILNRFKLINNSINIRITKEKSKNDINGKIINKISISNKDMKFYFLIYLMFILFIVIPSMFWFCFFPLSIFNIIDIPVNVKKPSFLLTFILCLSIIIINIIIINLKNYLLFSNKESKPKNINIYNRELPGKLTPAHVRLLVEDGKIDSKTLASTILDLIDRGYLKIDTIDRTDIFTKDIFISKTDKSQEDLFKYEKYLINWFFDNDKISSLELRKKLNDEKSNPYEKFSIFQGLVILSFPLESYYIKDKHKKPFKIYTSILGLSIFLFSCNIFFKNMLLYCIFEFLFLFSLAQILFPNPAYLLNDKGAETRDSYLDLKNFLLDFSLIHEKNSDMISLWNYYLSYSIALDISGIAYNEINDFFGTNIYNLNNQNVSDEDDCKEMIDNIPNDILEAKELYQKRN